MNFGKAEERAGWNTDIDMIHPEAGILWWLEFVRHAYGPEAAANSEANPDGALMR